MDAFLARASDWPGEKPGGLQLRGEGLKFKDKIKLENKMQNVLLLNLRTLSSANCNH